jgi:hypothetical protein
MDGLDWMDEPFSQLFLHRQKLNPRRKGALKMSITYHHATSHKLIRGWMHTSTFHNSFYTPQNGGSLLALWGELLIESPPILGFWT